MFDIFLSLLGFEIYLFILRDSAMLCDPIYIMITGKILGSNIKKSTLATNLLLLLVILPFTLLLLFIIRSCRNLQLMQCVQVGKAGGDRWKSLSEEVSIL